MPHTRQSNLTEEVYKILIPEEYLKDFAVNRVENHPEEWVIELVEKPERIPAALSGKDVVLDGYCNEVDILTHAFSLKKIYLRMYRRKWKERGSTKHYYNTYNLHIPGMKTTKEFRDFLKEIGG
jgi:ribosomal protein S8